MKDRPRIEIVPASYHTDYVPLVYTSKNLSDAEAVEDIKIFTGKVLSALGEINEYKVRNPKPETQVYDAEISRKQAQELRTTTSRIISEHDIRSWVRDGNGIHPERLQNDFVARIQDVVIVRGEDRQRLYAAEDSLEEQTDSSTPEKEMAEAA